MKNVIPINTTADGCAYTIRARYDGACLKSLTGGGVLPEHGGYGGLARTLTARYYKTGLSNILEHWDDGYATTGILEIMDDTDEGEGTSGDGHKFGFGRGSGHLQAAHDRPLG